MVYVYGKYSHFQVHVSSNLTQALQNVLYTKWYRHMHTKMTDSDSLGFIWLTKSTKNFGKNTKSAKNPNGNTVKPVFGR